MPAETRPVAPEDPDWTTSYQNQATRDVDNNFKRVCV